MLHSRCKYNHKLGKIHAPRCEDLNESNENNDTNTNYEKLILNTFQDKNDNIASFLSDLREEIFSLDGMNLKNKAQICVQLIHGQFSGSIGMRDFFQRYVVLNFDEILTEEICICILMNS